MSANYWVAKHTPDPFRAEPRNVGIVVELNGKMVARFIGENPDAPGVLDGRSLRAFQFPNVYRQWVQFWRDAVSSKDINRIISGNKVHFGVVDGGHVSDTGSDSAEQVCNFLFALLVSDAGGEAFFEPDAVESSKELALKAQLEEAFLEMQVLQVGAPHELPLVEHPVLEDFEVVGEHATHIPSFSQRNGHLFIYEVVDLTGRRPRHITDRAGWAAYMFSDVRAREHNLEAYSVIRLQENAADQQSLDYAKAMLTAESSLVNWSDVRERGRFLEARRKIALGAN